MNIRIKSFWPGIIMLVMATVLFCLPGKEFPEQDWFAKIYLDKWIHVGLFAFLVVLWTLPFIYQIEELKRLHVIFFWVMVCFIFYGIAIEFIQGWFIPYRTFGVDDIIADTIGCGLGYFWTRRRAKIEKT
jgi:glycopeptide antibiotics resistance protein